MANTHSRTIESSMEKIYCIIYGVDEPPLQAEDVFLVINAEH